MKRAPDGLGPVFALERRGARPLHRQVYDGYRLAIVEGRLRPGQRLPSTRSLASEMGISRIPVVTAFAQLATEGYVESRVGAGTFVSRALPTAGSLRGPRPRTGGRPGPRRVAPVQLPACDGPWLPLRGPFRLSQPALDEFPAALWTRLVAKHARAMSPKRMAYGDALGLPALRDALAAHLRTYRSVACDADQIMIVSGSQHALTLVWRTLLAPGDAVWLEEPGYEGARDALRLAGAKIVPVPVDDDGPMVDEGIARAPEARAAYLTPSHQYPLGVAMTASRRLKALAWARRAGAWLVEDDYDSEFRYEGQPLPSLQGLDDDARVIYVGTFSKILFPAVRVGYLVAPRDLVPALHRVRQAMDIFPAPLMQSVLAEFVADGHFARHLRRMRARYAERRGALCDAIAMELPDTLRVVGDRAGMHLVALLPAGTDDHAVSARAARRGISAAPLSACYLGPRKRAGLVLGYGGTKPRAMRDAVRTLKAAIEG